VTENLGISISRKYSVFCEGVDVVVQPRVSVCLASHNGEKYIYQQLTSILNQLAENDELIISDDSSTDSTIQIINSFKDNRIKVYTDNNFYSTIFNFENALKKASGEIIFLSDQDDIWEDNKVEIISKLLKKYDLVVSDCIIIDGEGRVTNDSFFKIRNSGIGILRNIYKNTYLGCCMAFNKNMLKYALPFPKYIPMHDMWIGIISELYGQSYFCNDKLIKYRRHENNVTPNVVKSSYGLIKQIYFRMQLMYSILKNRITVSLYGKHDNV